MNTSAHRNIISLISQIREAANLLITRELESRGIEGIVPAHGTVFAFLFRQSAPVPIMSLVKESGRSKSTITGIVKTLERYGYLSKQLSPDDGRSVLVSLTRKGLELKADFGKISGILLKRVFKGISPQDRKYTAIMLTTILNNLQ